MGRRAGPPQVRRHGATWWARYSVAGARHEVNLGLPATRPARAAQEAAEAHRARAVLAAGAVERRPAEPASDRRLDVLIFRYLDFARSLGRDAKYAVHHEIHLRAHFLRCDEEGQPTRWRTLDDITSPAIAAYTAERVKAVSTVTVHKELVTLSRFLKWAKREGILEHVPDFERPRTSSAYQPTTLQPAQVRKLIAALPATLRPWATFTWLMALRLSESTAIEWRDLDRRERTLRVRAEIDKAGRDWVLPLDPGALRVLAALPQGSPGARIFRVSRNQREELTRAGERLGLGHVTPHHLRHSRLTELGHSTRDVASLQYFARHTSLQTTDGYVHGRTAAAAQMLAESGRRRR